MSAPFALEIDVPALVKELGIATNLASDAMHKVMLGVARGAITDLMRLTPPFEGGAGVMRQAFGTQKKAGFRAVKEQIEFTQQPITNLDMWTRPTTREARALKRKRDLAGWAKILNASGFEGARVSIRARRDWHEYHRKSRGRVRLRKRRPNFVIEKATIRRYVKERQKEVGKAMAGWVPAARMLGSIRVPAWVSRHTSRGGAIYNRRALWPDITVFKGVSYVQWKVQRIIPPMIRNRRLNLKGSLERALRHAWSKQ